MKNGVGKIILIGLLLVAIIAGSTLYTKFLVPEITSENES